ncbi:MAG TPA: hypothetical protein DCZ92_10010 [Elusimicrobia bacterium]|nr:MAG: hypothetical protein A2016_07335 [Elusimicrobia bacterium GWF2_62_30]HBA61134.1 hypothetical protein [Elusimicrobiota bacterium]
MSFSTIKGQDKTIERLRSLVETGRVPPAMLFHGVPGIGKFPAAAEFASALNCSRVPFVEEKPRSLAPQPEDDGGLFSMAPEGPAPEAAPAPSPADQAVAAAAAPGDSCGVCLSCRQALSGAHPDIRVVDTVFQAALLDENESANLKIDTIRELTRWAQQKPMMSPWKIFIVRDAEALVPQAQNALLKTLEDPPKNTVVILTVSRKNSLLPTILSRCCSVEFSPLPAPVITELMIAQGAEPSEAARLAALSRGSFEKAAEARGFLARLAKLNPADPAKVFKFTAGLPRDSHAAREEVKTLLDLILGRLRAAWRASAPPAKDRLGAVLRRTLDLRRMADRNVSYMQILQTALLESERAGLRLESLVDAGAR